MAWILVVARRESMGETGGRSAARSLFSLAEPPDGCYASPAIPSIDLQPEELARRAAAVLLARMRGESLSPGSSGVGRLVVRDTT